MSLHMITKAHQLHINCFYTYTVVIGVLGK